MTSEITQAQADVRRVYSGGWGGPAVSAFVWLAAALTTDLVGIHAAVAVLFIAGAALVFPVNSIAEQGDERRGRLTCRAPDAWPRDPDGSDHGGGALITVDPLNRDADCVLPLAMVVVGAHYFPFAHLYGDPAFIIGGTVQCVAGLLILVTGASGSLGAYVMAGLLALMSIGLFARQRARRRGIA